MSKRICVLPKGQATQLERTGKVPPCSWHRHFSESVALELCRKAEAWIVTPAKQCKYPKPSIVLAGAKKPLVPTPTDVGASICGAPQMRTWQWIG
jgi:hypothetical protein